jgi:hypothetical protein
LGFACMLGIATRDPIHIPTCHAKPQPRHQFTVTGISQAPDKENVDEIQSLEFCSQLPSFHQGSELPGFFPRCLAVIQQNDLYFLFVHLDGVDSMGIMDLLMELSMLTAFAMATN